MEVPEAAVLIKPALLQKQNNAVWADLGCGSGTFTRALAGLLGAGSKIYALDVASQHIESPVKNVEIEFIKSDLEREPLPVSNLDGILMANSLHYIEDKYAFIKKISKALKCVGQIILVEYDTERANQWIPYPIRYDKAIEFFSDSGFADIKKVGERTSVYRREKMYACSIRQTLGPGVN